MSSSIDYCELFIDNVCNYIKKLHEIDINVRQLDLSETEFGKLIKAFKIMMNVYCCAKDLVNKNNEFKIYTKFLLFDEDLVIAQKEFDKFILQNNIKLNSQILKNVFTKIVSLLKRNKLASM